MTSERLESLREDWKEVYGKTLPSLALSKAPTQVSWPVHVDHCFGRIIMDNAIGKDEPWMAKIKSPAVKNMTGDQLKKCIALGQAIAEGKENLADLDARSLQLRGKQQKPTATGKRKRETVNHVASESPPKKRQLDIKSALSPSSKRNQRLPQSPPTTSSSAPSSKHSPTPSSIDPDLHDLITSSRLSPFRQRVLLALCQVPPGHFTTYAALSTHLHSSARAVGNALRNNPFAPKVPCHRVVAADKGLGGFGGEWGKDGKHAGEKIKLLRDEGVIVDVGRGRIEGSIWSGFA
ncbi:MAG: hypothetical protein Q9219_000294 [cf. Caloplaca sp. 3 TL-2023]